MESMLTEDTTDTDQKHAQIILKDFGIKSLGECYSLNVQSNTL